VTNTLLEPLQYGFIVRAILASVIVGVVCSIVGTFIVLRGMAFFGDALAHAILPGVAVVPAGRRRTGAAVLGALVAALLAASALAHQPRRATEEDTAIGVVFAGAFAWVSR